ncbi:hypothetical protein JCGZ_20884 [Jatropha curcas]|uniref:NB-ARC domain-containing protein n=1 Tax=Jatropha curcas TaxID=180498 RepID=A0A067LI18_JATCU|nr:hypothetical protein JCGZ_20884 [Jatropha curcas]
MDRSPVARYADLSNTVLSPYALNEIMYDIEDLIDELIIRSAQRRSAEAIIRCVLSLVDLPRHPYDLEIGTTIVSPVISKFEVLATKIKLWPAVRKQARWLRDEFKSLKVFLKDLESRETLSERGMAWTEELCDVCRSTQNVVGLFLTKNEKGNKSLFWSPRNFISQRNVAQQMARIQVKVSDISERRYEAIHQRTWHRDRYPSITPPTATPQQLDIDMVSFEEDVDAVIKQLLKDDPRCLTISIVGVKGTGKTNLAKLICDSQDCICEAMMRAGHCSRKIKIPPELEQNLKKHILRKCGGLPKVIVKLAELLSHREATLEEWSTALDQLNQDEEPWSTVLEEINKYLPLYLRRCLFYFGLFPVGYKVPARRLMALWVAEGLGRQKNDDNSPEDAAEACLRELISYNMVQVTERKPNGKVKTCSQPEALRVHWFAKAKEANFLRGKKMLCKDGGFPKLEVLKLWELELLEEWNMEKGAMPSLKHLEIRRCINLKMLPDALRCIDTLREVKLIKVPMLSSTLKDKQNENLDKIAHVRRICIED